MRALYVVALEVELKEQHGKMVAVKCEEADEDYTTTMLHIIHDALDREEEAEQKRLNEELCRLRYAADRYDREDGILEDVKNV
jgi:hypothetical protein